LLTVIVISSLLQSVFGKPPFLVRVATRLLMLPLVAGTAYEFIRFASRNMDNPLVRMVVTPNLMLQRLTTREPSLEMIEVAITAFERAKSGDTEAEASVMPERAR
jgi:uncharacterized protein YqhQ